MTPGKVELDTAELEAGVRQLAAGLERSSAATTLAAATDAADRIRAAMPKITGAAASSVTVERGRPGPVTDAAVSASSVYFGWLNWGGTRGRAYVAEGRYTGPAVAGAAKRFQAACMAAAAGEIHRL